VQKEEAMRKLMACVGFLVLSVLPVGALSSSQDAERSRTQGIKETEKFVKAGGQTTEAVGKAKVQTQKTLDAYNALVTQPTSNMKGDYKRLMKDMDAMNARVAEAQQKVDLMQQAADTYFTGRAATIKDIQSQDLQDRAKQRMAESQKQFEGVLQSLREGAQALEPFRKELADQITYLGSDLTPSAMTSLKPNADKLNAQGATVFEKTDKAINTANSYFQSLRASES
jgi:predicted  nucleic acid-binding Zn-ribbon protein